jgi:TolB-like protein
MPNRTSFFAELQRRHVYKVGAMYCVAGWLLVQVVTQVLPVFDVFTLGQRILVLLVVAGLPLALVLAWLFDITPQGIVRTAEVPVEETPVEVSQRHGMERRLNVVLGLLVLLGLGYFATERLGWIAPHPAAAAADKSIAVLPFDNLSDDKANAYFAEGIQDQVLTQLAKIGALKVISRTSTQQYASHPANIGDIARQLGVANVLEGSVQRAGDAVRINVQLIRADGDSHLWAETYDRKLDNIFGVESEVAEAIAQALNTRLSGAEQQELAQQPTRNVEAWDAYLRARVLFERGEQQSDEDEALHALQGAVSLDPDFAAAWALMSEIHAAQNIEFHDTSETGHRAALEALRQAQRLQPQAAETQLAQAYYDFWVEHDYAGARQQLEQALQRTPTNAEVRAILALLARRQGRWQDSLAAFDQAIALDPRNLETLSQAAVTAAGVGDFVRAGRYLGQAQNAGGGDDLLLKRVLIEQAQGHLDAAAPLLARTPADSGLLLGSALYRQYLLQHRYAEGVAVMRGLVERLAVGQAVEHGTYTYFEAELLRLAGDPAAALAAYRQAREMAGIALQAQPGNGALINLQALIAARLGEEAAARAFHQQALWQIPAGGDALFEASAQNTLARVEARLGHREAALAALQRLAALPDIDTQVAPPFRAATLALDPEWDALRDDPRFRTLLADSTKPRVVTP